MFALVAFVVCGLVASGLVSHTHAYPSPFQIAAFQMDDPFRRQVDRVEVEGDNREAVKRKSNSVASMRNCFFSPVQCLLPVDNNKFQSFSKRRFFEFEK